MVLIDLLRLGELIDDCQTTKLGLLKEFSLSVPKEMYKEQYGEYAY